MWVCSAHVIWVPYNPSLSVCLTGFRAPHNLEEGKKPQHTCLLEHKPCLHKPPSLLCTGLRMQPVCAQPYLQNFMVSLSQSAKWKYNFVDSQHGKNIFLLCSVPPSPHHRIRASVETKLRKSDARHKCQRRKEEGKGSSCTIFFKCQMKVQRIHHGCKNIESLPKTTFILGYLRHKISGICIICRRK